MKFHRFDEQAAYESTFSGVVWQDGLPFMNGPQGQIPVTIAAAERYSRERENAFGQGYRDLDSVLQNLKENAYWSAISFLEKLKASGHEALLPDPDEEAI